MAKVKMVICPWCGEPQSSRSECRACHRGFDAQTREDLLGSMGPWFVRDEGHPFSPGLSYDRLVELVRAGELDRNSIVRGPTTRQMWTAARRTAGVSHLVGYCYACDEHVRPDARSCPKCHAAFGRYPDRNFLGLPETEGGASRWTPPPPEPAGISSFALDEELLSPVAVVTDSGSPESSESTASPVSSLPTPSASQGASPPAPRSTGAADPAMMTLRREVDRLERRGSLLLLSALVIAALLPISAVIAYRAGQSAPQVDEPASAAASARLME